MEIRVPIDRSMVVQLLKACAATLFGKSTTLSFECQEMKLNGEEQPLILSRRQAADLQKSHMAVASRAGYLEELVAETINGLPEGHPIAEELQSGLDAINGARTLH